MFRLQFWASGLAGLLMLFSGMAAHAETPAGEGPVKVIAIDVSGNTHIEKGTILDRVYSRVGQPLDRREISRDVKRLYETGFFSDVHVVGHRSLDGVRLEYVVSEYPLIGDVSIEGNKEVAEKDLKFRLKLKPGLIYNPNSVRADINTIRKGYLKKGYYQVGVSIEEKPRKNGVVDLVIHISEGQVTRIKRIRFIGNKVFSDDELREVIASKQQDAMTWLTDRDVFDKKRLQADTQMLLQHYMNRGYLDVRAESTMVNLSEDKSSFDLTFALQEGIQYTVGKLELQGDIVPDKASLMAKMKLESGETFSLSDMQQSISDMTEVVGDEGYAFANITPLFKRDLDNHIVDITFDIEKGKEVYVEKIEVAGNVKTNDTVIRREIRQQEGARYSASQVRRSRERLTRIEYLKDVRVSLPKGSGSNLNKMRVEVEEKQSGSFSFGVGYSQLESVFLQAKVQEKNLLGKGYQGSLDGTIGTKSQNFTSSITDPYLFGEDISGTLSLYRHKANPLSQVTYQRNDIGGSVGFGIPLTEYLNYNIGYNFDRTTLKSVPANSSLLIRSQLGTQTTGEVYNSLSYDTRDQVISPTKGHRESIMFSYAGLGGKNHFWQASASTSSYFAFGTDSDFVFSPFASATMIRPLKGQPLPLTRRLSMGGIGTVRGFDSYGISLRDPATQEAVGGDKMFNAGINLFFPVPYMQTHGFRGVLFADSGTVWGSIPSLGVTERFSFAKMRASVGFGIEWISPVGPIGITWGFPVRTQPGDVKRKFEFAMGTTF